MEHHETSYQIVLTLFIQFHASLLQGCIISPKDRSGGGGKYNWNFRGTKGGDPWTSGKNIGKSQFWVGKDIGTPWRIYIPDRGG